VQEAERQLELEEQSYEDYEAAKDEFDEYKITYDSEYAAATGDATE
jgi:hypothetical protein